eukprot:6213854-Pleurochrysis_carterae.AAC.4
MQSARRLSYIWRRALTFKTAKVLLRTGSSTSGTGSGDQAYNRGQRILSAVSEGALPQYGMSICVTSLPLVISRQ